MKTKMTIYVGNLNYRLDEEDLLKLFRKYGKVLNVHLLPNEEGTRSGVAFVEMKDEDQAQKAILGLNGAIIAGRTLKVSVAKERFSPPSLKKSETSEDKVELPKKKSVPKMSKPQGLAHLRENLKKLKSKATN